MIITQARRFVLFATILLLATNAFSWDDTGHKITAYIAWQQMTPAVRENVIKVLLDAPEDSTISAYYASYGSQTADFRKREFFMLMASWADVVRDRAFPVRYRKYHKSNWHYDDTFWTVRNGAIEVLPKPEDGGQALERIREYVETINSKAPDGQKAVPVAWLQHLIGDIHQPLHTSARVTDREAKGDQGGNFFLLTPEGTPRDKQENLHWFWDSIVVRNEPNEENQCDIAFLEPIARKIMKDHPIERYRSRLAVNDPGEWAKESLIAAQNDVFSADLKRFEKPSNDYRKKAFRLGRERLALAGYRMGEVFNQAFGAIAPPSTSSPAKP